MSARIREFDWAQTPLGVSSTWPHSLKTALSICLASRFPILIWWGPELRLLYNDAYIPIFGKKHPGALGRPGLSLDGWGDEAVRVVIEPMLRGVMERGEATWSDDQRLILERYGFREETYLTWSYSPIPDDGRGVGGVFTAVTETTQKVIGERRLEILRELSAHGPDVRTAGAACVAALEVLRRADGDIPFAILYLLDEDGQAATRAGLVGLDKGHAAAPARLSARGGEWPLLRAMQEPLVEIAARDLRFDDLPGGPWPEAVSQVVLARLERTGEGKPYGFLVAGVSPRLRLDDPYRSFLQLAAGHIASGIANALAHEEERRRAEKLAELDRAKTTFFSNISHEFRTPLTLMLGPTEDLLASTHGPLPESHRAQLETVHRNELRLLRLVNTLLDFSRIEAGRAQASFEPVDLARLTAEFASVFRSAMEKAGLDFVVDCAPLPEPAYVDRSFWEKIVLNLLSNALKFTFEGKVEVRLALDGREVVLAVRDSGVGVPAAELPNLFKRFHRIEGTRARSYEGSGIGLALVSELVRMHGGSISASSEVNQGTTFTVRLPLGHAHLPLDQLRQGASEPSPKNAETYVEESSRWLPRLEWSEPATAPATAAPSHAGARVVLADDSADMRDYVARLLVRDGFEVLPAENGVQALELVREKRPDLVLTDVMMPLLDGFGVLRALRHDPATQTIPVLMLSARAGEEARVEGLEAGADDYLVKPFTARELLARVRTYLELTKLRRAAEVERDRLRSLLGKVPAVVNFLCGPKLVFDFVHPEMVRLLGGRELLGKPLLEALPELADQEFPRLLRHVLETGERVEGKESLARIQTSDLKDTYWNFVYLPVYGSDDAIEGVMTFGIDVTEQVAARKALQKSEQTLRDSNRRKDEFLAMLAHELRNPLAPIQTAVMLMETKLRRGDDPTRALEVVRRQSGTLARLVDDLLDVARVTRGAIELRKERVDLVATVNRALDVVQPLLDEKRHNVTTTLPRGKVAVIGDPVRVEQILVNLLTNAGKYTDANGRIAVAVESAGDWAVVRVKDSGIGIPAEMLGRVFDLFEQADRSLDRAQGGLGIGLTVARRLVELHGGSIVATSDGPGMGSTFEVRLRLAPAEEVPIPVAMEIRSGEGLSRESRPSRRVLIVDDNLDAAETLAELLQDLGHVITIAHDGLTALDEFERMGPDVVLLDIGLPGLDGYEVARRMRKTEAGGRTCLVALTGYGQPRDRARAIEAGFDQHLVKPVDIHVIEGVLANMMH
jgi:signal transduction histidine kinase